MRDIEITVNDICSHVSARSSHSSKLRPTPYTAHHVNIKRQPRMYCVYAINSAKMRVCGLFTVDAALPLRLMSLVTTYCIVLLQFAFLHKFNQYDSKVV
ncbi:hypothetical protein EVAR_56739_1 [Eumeta japonica]|uniref:Gustatory receptor n=1 Tax=Eumeta variegata TaxID=151549 RepID=A0A4C1ZVF2_EUMVA|nr:hypothetical protein EVAR_56739_1 [Eumeta japonica]